MGTLRRAVALADGRSESPWEPVLRVFHVLCQVPVEPQFEVFDDGGRFVARGGPRPTTARPIGSGAGTPQAT